MTYRLLADSGCNDGTCPTFFIDDETGDVKVRGSGPDGVTEIDVTIPAAKWAVLMTNVGR
jgi:hypothetical protein